VELHDAQAVPGANGSERTVGTRGRIGELRGTEAADAVAVYTLDADFDLLGEELAPPPPPVRESLNAPAAVGDTAPGAAAQPICGPL